jgi:hypothetical protein
MVTLRAKNNRLTQGLGRAGMVCYGLVHVVVAYLALRVAFGDSGEQADQKGAIQEVGSTPFGAVMLWVLAVGLIAYGLWQFCIFIIFSPVQLWWECKIHYIYIYIYILFLPF